MRRGHLKRVIKMNATRKGLIGGSPLWRAVWVMLTLRKGWSKVSKSGEAPVTFTESLKEGEAWTIVHVPEQSKRGRGEGRKMLIGPKRTAPRATAITSPALASAGKRIIEAPSAARINEILGADVVSDPEPTKSELRARAKAEKRAEKRIEKAAKRSQRLARRAQRKADNAEKAAID